MHPLRPPAYKKETPLLFYALMLISGLGLGIILLSNIQPDAQSNLHGAADTMPGYGSGAYGAASYGGDTVLADTTPPTITIISPGNNSDVTSVLTVTFNASDDTGISSCSLLVNGTPAATTFIDAPLSTVLDPGTYRWSIACNDTSNNVGNSQQYLVQVHAPVFPDTTSPNVTLLAPADNNHTTNATPQFFFIASDDRGLQNCSLLIDGLINRTIIAQNNTPTSVTTTSLTSTTHQWNVLCADTSGNTATAPSPFNITIDIPPAAPPVSPPDVTTPQVTLVSPASGTTTTTAQQVLSFNATDDNGTIADCTLLIDGNETQIIVNITNGAVSEVNATFTIGTHEWNVRCADPSGNAATAATPYSITLQAPPITGGGGSGGGGGYWGGTGGTRQNTTGNGTTLNKTLNAPPVYVPNENENPVTPPTNEPVSPVEKNSFVKIAAMITGAALLILLLAFVLSEYVINRGKGEPDLEQKRKLLREFITQNMDEGHTAVEIQQSLLHAGWPRKYIDDAYATLNLQTSNVKPKDIPLASHPHDPLVEYITHELGRGHDIVAIRNALLQAGWKKENIDPILERITEGKG